MTPDEHAAEALRQLALAERLGVAESLAALTHAVLSLRPAAPAAPSDLFVDTGGDVWGAAPDGRLWLVGYDTESPWELGQPAADVEAKYGPLRPFPVGPA